MIACDSCHRHYRVDEVNCPFCKRSNIARNLITGAVGGALTTIVLAACYGGVPDKYTYTTAFTGDTGTTTTTPPTTGDTGTTITTTTTSTTTTTPSGTGDTGAADTGTGGSGSGT